ncbi:BRO family protein [Sulfitobacter dubius]|uniref:BRO family protein n=1 Tax=Sulfitobacter dubius TaxID=218673 RepID=UPI0022AE62BF|nr:BRO family protein [Sulfitobacter dubius]MCZ4367543.1 BRO family protein [Sulfitobacter dubius]
MTNLPNLSYRNQKLRRVSHDGVELFSLKDILIACEYRHDQNHSLYYNRVKASLIKRLSSANNSRYMVFASEEGVMQMVLSMAKPEASEFFDWFISRPSDHPSQKSNIASTEKADLRTTLAALQADILARDRTLHQMRVEAATIQAAIAAS